MTREYERLKAADEYIKNRIKEGQGRTGDVFPSFLEGAEWADANPDRDTIACISLISAEQAKKQMIEKACKWLENNADAYIGVESYAILRDNFFEDFRKAMQDFTPHHSQKP